MKRRVAALLAAPVALALAGPAGAADPVTLRSFDGSITLRGELLEFDGEAFRLATAIGELRIDAMQVTCEGAGCPPPELLRSEFRISGSRVIAETVMPALIEAYGLRIDGSVLREPQGDASTRFTVTSADRRPLAVVTVDAPEGGDLFDELLANSASIAMAERRIRPREVTRLRDAGLGQLDSERNEHILALDGIAAIVAPGNPLASIAVTDLAGVFSGRITDWAQLGGRPGPIRVLATGREDGTREAFEALVTRPLNLELAPGLREMPDGAALADAVAADPLAIGIASTSNLRGARALPIRFECGLLASPDAFSIKAEEYPLARRLYLYTADRPLPPQARRLLDFALSDAAQDVIADAGLVDLSVSSLGIGAQGLRIANALLQTQAEATLPEIRAMLAEIVDAERLSLTFRFEPGAAGLDARARNDLRRLARLIEEGRFDGRELLLAGFTDAVGRADLNRTLSLRRAEQVRDALAAAVRPGALDRVRLTLLGFGELAPVGCNETFDGRRINRRVEIWLRDRA